MVILLSSNHLQILDKKVKQDSLLYPHLSAPSAPTLRATQCCVRAFLQVHLRISFGAERCCSFAFYFYWRFHSIVMVSCGQRWTFSRYELRLSDRNLLAHYWNGQIHGVRFVFQSLIY